MGATLHRGSSPRRSPRAPVASERVRTEWMRRIEAEYRSAAITQHLTLWLLQAGASPDLIRAGLRIVNDELAHADLSHRTYLAAGGKAAPPIARASLMIARRAPEVEPLEHDIVRVCTEVFCLGETVAVPMFKELRQNATVPAARRALDRILRDEVRHRDFGWNLLRWMFECAPDADVLRRIVVTNLPSFFARQKQSYAPVLASKLDTADEADLAWGLMAPARYASILERALVRDYVPRFKALGIEARAAWNAAP